MSRYILDTNIISYLQTDSSQSLKIKKRLQNLQESDEVAVSIIVLYELVYGLNSVLSISEQNATRESINLIQDYLSIIPLDMKEVEIFSKLKRDYKNHTGINKNAIKRHNLDLLIASTAIALDAILISNDKIFETLSEIEPNLKYQNWLKE